MAIDDSFTKRSAEALKAPTQDSNGRPTSATITAGNINTLGSSWDVLPGRLRLNNANGAVGADPILYESSGVLKTGRADLSETDANQPPVLEHRGQLLVGGGLVGVSARMIPRIKHALSPYLEVGSEGSRTLRSETTRGTSNFAATREYGYDANYTDYDMYEQTHNARWDSPSQTWVKDQGGTPASRLYVHNIGLVFQTEDSLASSFTTAAWSPGPINVGAITATAATIGGVAFSTVSSNLTTLTNDYNNHATSSSTHHDGRYSQIGHGHNGTYLRIVFVHDDFFTNGQEKIFFEAKADHIFYTTNIGNFYYHAHNNNFWNAFDIAQRNDGQMTVKNNTGTDCNVRITGVMIF
jgi:hypothetical protein